MNSSEGAAIRALDRKLTDGLNLVHGQLAVMRDERREDRQEFREFRNEIREDRKELRAELRAEIAKVDKRVSGLETAMREEIAGLETAMRAEIGKVDDRGKELATAIRELTAQVSTALERSFGTRRLVRGVLGALALLVAGGMIRPLAERVVSSLLGG